MVTSHHQTESVCTAVLLRTVTMHVRLAMSAQSEAICFAAHISKGVFSWVSRLVNGVEA
jgi:hypothetical protein